MSARLFICSSLVCFSAVLSANAQVPDPLVIDTMTNSQNWTPAASCKQITQDGITCVAMSVTKQEPTQYQGISRNLSNMDFSAYDALTFKVKTDVPCSFLQVLVRNTEGIYAEIGVPFLAGHTLEPGRGYFIVWPYKSNPGWVHPFVAPDRKMDFTSIKLLNFYTDMSQVPAATASFCLSDIRLLKYAQLQKELASDPVKLAGNEQFLYAVLDEPLPSMIPDYMMRLLNGQLKNYAQPPRTIDEWNQTREQVRQRFYKAMGFTPGPRPVIKTIEKGKIDCPNYTIEKFLLQTRPGIYMTCNIYIPKNLQTRSAAVLVLGGHGESNYSGGQERCAPLAIHGYIAMNVDNFKVGERSDTSPSISESDDAISTAAFAVAGPSLAGMMLYDHICAMDYLCSRPEVDANHVGVTGVSGGATYSLALAIVDERVAACVPVCSNLPAFAETIYNGSCQFLPGIYEVADNAQLYATIAPRALLYIDATRNTTYSLEQIWKIQARTQDVYKLLGVADKHQIALIEGVHSYSLPMREAAVGFFDKWLRNKGDGSPVKEPNYVRVDPMKLRCFPDNKRPENWLTSNAYLYNITLAAAQAQGNPPGDANALQKWRQSKLTALRSALGKVPSAVTFAPRQHKTVVIGNYTVEKFSMDTEPGITVPFVIARKTGLQGRLPAMIMVHPGGKTMIMTGSLAHSLLDANIVVVAVDVRDTGETWYPFENETSYLNIFDNYIHYAALDLGYTAVSMWSFDLQCVFDYCSSRSDIDASNISVYGCKQLGLSALVTAALNDKVSGVYIEAISPTYVCHRGYGHPYIYRGDNTNLGGLGYISSFIPEIMHTVGDIPQIMSMVAPRRLVVIAPLWADGTPMSEGEFTQACGWPTSVYALTNARSALISMVGAPTETVVETIRRK